MTDKLHSPVPRTPLLASSVALGFIALCLAVYVFHVARGILVPFVVAVFIWYLINAIARGLDIAPFIKFKIPRLIRFALAIAIMLGGLWFIIDLISQNIADVVRSAPVYQKNLERMMPEIVRVLGLEHEPTVTELLQYINVGFFVTLIAKTFTGFAGKTLVVLFYVGFLLYEQRFFNRKIIAMIEDQDREDRVREILHKIDVKIQRYIGVKSFVSLVDSVLTYLILSLAGVDFAEFWGLMAFFLHFIPYAGSFIAITLPSLIALIQFGDIHAALVVFGCLCLSHAFIGHILDPFLMGNNLNLSPICIITSLAMWGMIWGIPGMFLAIPILASITIILSQFPRTRPAAVFLSKTGEIEKESKAKSV